MAKGDYVAMLDHDDALEPGALSEIVRALNEDPLTDVLYTDQDYVHPDGRLSRRFYKPDWSLELFRGVMYVGHLLVVRRSTALEVGGFNPQFDNVQDFEFMLRVAEHTDRIRHVPQILYHWRMIEGSVADSGTAKPNIEALQAAAVNGHFQRCGIKGEALSSPLHAHRVIIQPLVRSDYPLVTVVTPGPPSPELIVSLQKRTRYKNLLFSSRAPDAEGQFAIFVEAGIEPVSEDWVEQLLFYAERSTIGLVAPLILDEHGAVDTAGLILREGDGVVRAMQGEPATSDGYAGSLSCSREVSAVSGECFMVGRAALNAVGGIPGLFDSPLYRGADLSLRARRTGLQNICNVRATVRRTRKTDNVALGSFDKLLFGDIWADAIAKGDPFHNPNFAPDGSGYIEKAAVAAA
jgi:GT2 family glycosyltransferase